MNPTCRFVFLCTLLLATVTALGQLNPEDEGYNPCNVDVFPATAGIKIDEYDGEKFFGEWSASAIKFRDFNGVVCEVVSLTELFEKNITCHYSDRNNCNGPLTFMMTVDFDDGQFWVEADSMGRFPFLRGVIIYQDSHVMVFYGCDERKSDGSCYEDKQLVIVATKGASIAANGMPTRVAEKLATVCVPLNTLSFVNSASVCSAAI